MSSKTWSRNRPARLVKDAPGAGSEGGFNAVEIFDLIRPQHGSVCHPFDLAVVQHLGRPSYFPPRAERERERPGVADGKSRHCI
jgi:hypothetical protein